jgi:hypothetical protein
MGYTLLWFIQLLPLLSLTPLPPIPHFSTAFNTHPYIHTFTSYAILLMRYHSLLLSLFPKIHRVVPLLQTCSTSEFVYDHAWLLHMFIFAFIFYIHMKENLQLLWVFVGGGLPKS